MVSEDESQSELCALRGRIQELEEERNDYHDSLHKETEKSMERGRQLLLLQVRTATAKQQEDFHTTKSHDPPLDHKGKVPVGKLRPTDPSEWREVPRGQRISPGETQVPKDTSISSSSRLERQLQQQVKELSERLSEAEKEVENRVNQVLRLFKYKRQHEQFATQSRPMCSDDRKQTQAPGEQTMDPGREQALLRTAPQEEMEWQRVLLEINDCRLLRETNSHISEKLQESRRVVAELQSDIGELRTSLKISTDSREKFASTLRDVEQSHSREKVTLENQIRSLESDVARAHLNIEQLNEEKTSLASVQDLVDESIENLASQRAFLACDRQILVEEVGRLEYRTKQLEAENTSLANVLSEVEQEFKNLKPRFLESQLQVRAAKSRISVLQTKLQNQESGLWDAASRYAADVNALEARITELSESHNKASAGMTKRDEELSNARSKINSLQTMVQSRDASLEDSRAKHAEDFNRLEARIRELSKPFIKASDVVAKKDQELNKLRIAYLEKERALQETQQNHQRIVKELDAKVHETLKLDAEIARLRHFEQAVKDHERTIKKLEQDREEILRQDREQLRSLTDARQQIILQRQHNGEPGQSSDALHGRPRELNMTGSENRASVTQFLEFILHQTGRQIEDQGGELGNIVEIGQPDDATLKQLGDRLQKKLDMLEHELQWYRNDRATVHGEYRRLMEWRSEIARNMAAMLHKMTGSGQPSH